MMYITLTHLLYINFSLNVDVIFLAFGMEQIMK